MDWSIITPYISCGGGPDVEGVRGLLRYGHTHVLDLRHTQTDSDLYWMNFVYCRNPTFDDGATKEKDWFIRGIRFAWGAFMYPEHRLYVGCHQGIHRAPSMVAAILMAQGHSRAVAYDIISRARPGIEPVYIEDAERTVHFLRTR